MSTAAWAAADPYTIALRAGRGPLFLRRADGWLLPLEVERWCARADLVDLDVLDRCEGAVLDVGCGPGRLVAELAARGRAVLGVDVSGTAVERALRLGGPALRRSVFEPLPGEGRWNTVLLMDGNVGIGGDPPALLDRVAELLAPGGLLIAETAPLDVDERAEVQVVDAVATGGFGGSDGSNGFGGSDQSDESGGSGGGFPWARVGSPALLRYARRARWRAAGQWAAGGRRFVALRSRSASSTAEAPKSTAVISSQRVRKPSGDSPVADR
ncbi:class I SAM-dependent methyltransferase [Streptomyces graminilatus]|uniref:class I SAM-dependent methyltransferase n=1 Tax=Streptomyces graminilatus TaxID=1464070 RepID=UPI0006E1FABD|nr:class I SAM-dependent methyltransferase [Streptomyces graminilatus]